MPKQQSSIYNFNYFRSGSEYSATSDFRRFVTVDYNMESYIGIVGVGIISGWSLEHIQDLTIRITPGSGVIDGFFAESPYSVKKRSEMVGGEYEISVVRKDSQPEPYMSAEERAKYIKVVERYETSFNPPPYIENAYVKVATPHEITLSNNTDTYIYVERKHSKPYPLLSNYPSVPSTPSPSDYDTYDAYISALSTYENDIQSINDYQWYDTALNRFTEVEFKTSSSFVNSNTKVLLGKVITRSSTVQSIDVSEINSLSSLDATIRAFANNIVPQHKHGGTKSYDPPKIKLQTDIRHTAMTYYNGDSQQASFQILENDLTSKASGHKHRYFIDANGNGITVDQIGSGESHYHKISAYTVSTSLGNNAVTSHAHTISSVTDNSWTSESQYIVYLNDEKVGDESSSNIIVDLSEKTIKMNGIMGGTYKTFSSTFEIMGETYSFTKRSPNVYMFMLSMAIDFNSQMGSKFTTKDDYDIHPFIFYNNDGTSVSNLESLKLQSIAASTILNDEGDSFTFTPNAARNVTVQLTSYKHIEGVESDTVKIEVLGNVEVTGSLQAENIIYINASKFTTGEFAIERLPFISHVGRMNEEFIPVQYPLVSNDGIQYFVSPATTTSELDHYHTLSLNINGNGTTSNLYIDGKPSYYASDADGENYLVNHDHGVTSNKINEAVSEGLKSWYNTVNSESLNSSSHSHTVISPQKNNPKIVYCVQEDRHGNIYAGTSDGLIMIPYGDAYLFVINGYQFYIINNDLWDALIEAKGLYENETNIALRITENMYLSDINRASSNLVNHEDSVFLEKKDVSSASEDRILIKKVSWFKVPDYSYEGYRKQGEISTKENIQKAEIVQKSTGDILDPDAESTQTIMEDSPNSIYIRFTVKRKLDDVVAWGIVFKTTTEDGKNVDRIITSGSDYLVYNQDLHDNFYVPWSSLQLPIQTGVITSIILDHYGDIWGATDNGIIVSRNNQKKSLTIPPSQPGLTTKITSLETGEYGAIYCTTQEGIYKTIDRGKTWTQLYDNNNSFKEVVRDYSQDKTNNIGHFHLLDVNSSGDGQTTINNGHSHTVSSWQIGIADGHSHTIYTTLYAIDENNQLYKSIDNGTNWTFLTDAPDYEWGNLCAVNNIIGICTENGLYRFSGDQWIQSISEKIFSCNYSYDLSQLYLGAVNQIYTTSDLSSFTSTVSMDGSEPPTLLINGTKDYFGYTYCNASNSFIMKDLFVSDATISALVDFGSWISSSGGWGKNILYDIYFNNILLESTKYDIDNTNRVNGNVSVDSKNGRLDFSFTSDIENNVSVNDTKIEIKNTTGLAVGDSVCIKSSESIPEEPVVPSFSTPEQVGSYMNELSLYIDEKDRIQESIIFATISNITENTITVSKAVDKNINVPAKIYRIPPMGGSSSIFANIYESYLSNSGELTHNEIEDQLSYKANFNPFGISNSVMSNLLQLTQGVRYVYPDIHSTMNNVMFYDFHYEDGSNGDLPDIDTYVDRLNSASYSQSLYRSNIVKKQSASINDILVGEGNFAGNIFVATDIGIFWAQMNSSVEKNWFYVFSLPYTIHELITYRDKYLIASTQKGTYITEDLSNWILQSSAPIAFRSYSLSLRWIGRDTKTISSHTAILYNETTDDGDDVGAIVSQSGDLYSSLTSGRAINVKIGTGTNDKNGNYIIRTVSPIKITVTPIFSGEQETLSNVVLKVGAWWENFDGETNLDNSSLTNPLVIGGAGRIAVGTGSANIIWADSQIPEEASETDIHSITPLTDGTAIASATNNKQNPSSNYLLSCRNNGETWEILKKFPLIKAEVIDSYINEMGHSVIKVKYTDPFDYIYQDGEMENRQITINDSSSRLGSSYVVWNYKFIDNFLIMDGKEFYDTINSQSDSLSVNILPPVINDVIEDNNGNIYFGTAEGLFYDNNTLLSNENVEGHIEHVGVTSTVSSVDLSGVIKSVTQNVSTNNVILSITGDHSVAKNELTNDTLFLTTSNPSESYAIIENTARTDNNEMEVEIDASYSTQWSFNVGKKIKVIPQQTKLYINPNRYIMNNEFTDGKVIVTSNENNNQYTSYNVVSNNQSSITIDQQLLPDDQTALIAGQQIALINASNQLELTVLFNRTIKDNDFVNFSFSMADSYGESALYDITVKSHSQHQITLSDFSSQLDDGNIVSAFDGITGFVLSGFSYNVHPNFSHKKTTISSDHYHLVQMINKTVEGKISAFTATNSSYVEFSVKETQNFSLPSVQQDGTLFKGAKIHFYNPSNIGAEFIGEIVSHDSSTIKVKRLTLNKWDFSSYNKNRISSDWSWEIDTTVYGRTISTIYKDFTVINVKITQDINESDTVVWVEDTTGINVNDRIKITQSDNTVETNIISNVIDAFRVRLSEEVDRNLKETKGLQLKVIRDVFTNDHEHQIRSNAVETVSVEEYYNRGYDVTHSHRVIGLLREVSSMTERNQQTVIAGSSSKIYENPQSTFYNELVDLNDSLENDEKIKGISKIITSNGSIIAGTKQGRMFVENRKASSVLPLEKPSL